MSDVIKCARCRKRYRGHGEWNDVSIAGLSVGCLCPGCQTVEEDLEAELAEITGRSSSGLRVIEARTRRSERDLTDVVEVLVNTYPTPEILRHNANELSDARKDEKARDMVTLMRAVASDMEAGTLREDA
ncbi:hypothetical protein BN000_05543 [Mycobacterium numidiamassiliense]|uniref:Uncharacterized protein n=1 Tax=Mycobacterium numidiamassiliense TaxID=1841861 RepID=A0A2U3PIM0_9MYCO|nr:hypothetical protein [Mycobacterium numidiamassiliense]SPM43592.1 hypothetical protein BN000_05543 [Mycobacterium numidiamassiliense]